MLASRYVTAVAYSGFAQPGRQGAWEQSPPVGSRGEVPAVAFVFQKLKHFCKLILWLWQLSVNFDVLEHFNQRILH